jgi:hypothetical protein
VTRVAALAVAMLVAPVFAAPPTTEKPVFDVVIGANGPLAGEDENAALFPVGGGPSSFAVDADGRWWVLDAIGGRVVVFERDGHVAKTIPFPLAGKSKRPAYRSDLELDGAGGLFLVDASARRVEHWTKDGSRAWTAGSESLPRGKGGLDLPQRVERSGESLYISDRGSERLLRFTTGGDFESAVPGVRAIPLPGGGQAMLSGEGDAIWLEMSGKGAHGRPILKLTAAEGRTLHDASLVGSTKDGGVVIAHLEGGAEAADQVRVVVLDLRGATRGELSLPLPADEATPVRRWRMTPAGSLAWFRLSHGRFQAFESALPEAARPVSP